MVHLTIARVIVLDIDWNYTMTCFPPLLSKNTEALIDMHDEDERMVRLR